MKSNLEKIMTERGLTIRALEQRSAVNNVTILKARKDAEISRCTLATLEKIADALDISVHDLFDDEKGLPRAVEEGPEDSTVQQIKNLEKRIETIESKLKLLSS